MRLCLCQACYSLYLYQGGLGQSSVLTLRDCPLPKENHPSYGGPFDQVWSLFCFSSSFYSKEVAQEYLNQVYRLHGMPNSIVSDKNRAFVGGFCQELYERAGTKLLSTAYHPQTDGQTEVLNRCLEGYLRCMTGETPTNWCN